MLVAKPQICGCDYMASLSAFLVEVRRSNLVRLDSVTVMQATREIVARIHITLLRCMFEPANSFTRIVPR